ncbi:hypothetical protein H2200_000895 [Cladophialophora chaetospira]|uniref:Uncharacterized protein n=1 Tax=Cladophialophora chaetospira TaxID=386627 RepID=A0AA38XQE0_9EURO|nr:hypothetical protein H2200_000895 [Cladophialophora chaetospira]
MSKEISQEFVFFSIAADKTGSIRWRADFVDDNVGDTAEHHGILLTQRRPPLEIEDDRNIPVFERSWRTLSLLAEEWAWLNGSVRITSQKHHNPIVIAWDIQSSAWEARAANRQDDEMQLQQVGTTTVNGRTYSVYKATVENSIFPDPLKELPMFEASFFRGDGKKG